ncbi:MAG: response regulator transcription factor [Pyrinomonadaceae bacterium]|nr:response regulator transcription factor [Phycisphaerales bacterium]
MQFGHRALGDSRTNEEAFKEVHEAVGGKLTELKALIVKAAGLLANQTPAKAECGIRVMCVDDSPDITTVMRMMIDAAPTMECVGCLASADHLVDEARRLTSPPNSTSLVVLLDAMMPGKSPFAVMSELASDFPEIRTLIFSGHTDSAFIDRAMDAGAWGCVSKDEPPEVVIRAVKEVAAGSAWWPPRPNRR